MLDIAINPYSEPLKKFWNDLKITKWKFPYILQLVYAIITVLLLTLLLILYLTIGIVSQISNSFWDLIAGFVQKMSFSIPITSSFYALSATIYFILFLPFFIIQSPIWLSGWFSSKIGIKPFIALLMVSLLSAVVYFYKPQIANDAINEIIIFQEFVKSEYFSSDSVSISEEQLTKLPNITTVE
jgi:hypothetical protein